MSAKCRLGPIKWKEKGFKRKGKGKEKNPFPKAGRENISPKTVRVSEFNKGQEGEKGSGNK